MVKSTSVLNRMLPECCGVTRRLCEHVTSAGDVTAERKQHAVKYSGAFHLRAAPAHAPLRRMMHPQRV